jgi:farnesyl-diphosphate farnesyltransferase
MDTPGPPPAATLGPPAALLTELLSEVSRSFYLTVRVLPRVIRPQIGLAYLLARTTDTIADTEIVPVEERLLALQLLRRRILGKSQTPLTFGDLSSRQSVPAERALLERVEEALALLNQSELADKECIRDVLDVITSGQDLDLRRFAGASAKRIVALQTEVELDDYTYRVAGCVGEFWTKMCRAHLLPQATLDWTILLANGVRFGKGLQLVNILRDLPADLRKGRCYLPAARLAACGLAPHELLQPATAARFRPLYHALLDQAQAHLAAGWDYTNALPRTCVRVRLACAWPILIGIKTLGQLRVRNVLDPEQRIKISRREVRRLITRSVICYPWASAWRGLFAKIAAE